MKIKGNWAFGVTASYVVFIGLLIWFLIFSLGQGVDLVEDDYYQQELVFQGQIDRVQRTRALEQQPAFSYGDNLVSLRFPPQFSGSNIDGRIVFYRPSDSGQDYQIEVTPGSDLNQVISVAELQRGLWRMKVHWSVEEVGYYNEAVFIFQ